MEPHGMGKGEERGVMGRSRLSMTHCCGDGQEDGNCGEDGQGNDEGDERVGCAFGHGGGGASCGGGGWGAGDGESQVEWLFLLAPGPPNSKTMIQQDGASHPISGDT